MTPMAQRLINSLSEGDFYRLWAHEQLKKAVDWFFLPSRSPVLIREFDGEVVAEVARIPGARKLSGWEGSTILGQYAVRRPGEPTVVGEYWDLLGGLHREYHIASPWYLGLKGFKSSFHEWGYDFAEIWCAEGVWWGKTVYPEAEYKADTLQEMLGWISAHCAQHEIQQPWPELEPWVLDYWDANWTHVVAEEDPQEFSW